MTYFSCTYDVFLISSGIFHDLSLRFLIQYRFMLVEKHARSQPRPKSSTRTQLANAELLLQAAHDQDYVDHQRKKGKVDAATTKAHTDLNLITASHKKLSLAARVWSDLSFVHLIQVVMFAADANVQVRYTQKKSLFRPSYLCLFLVGGRHGSIPRWVTQRPRFRLVVDA